MMGKPVTPLKMRPPLCTMKIAGTNPGRGKEKNGVLGGLPIRAIKT